MRFSQSYVHVMEARVLVVVIALDASWLLGYLFITHVTLLGAWVDGNSSDLLHFSKQPLTPSFLGSCVCLLEEMTMKQASPDNVALMSIG